MTRGQQRLIHGSIAVIASLSILAWLDFTFAGLLALVPERVWHGQVWRLVTWVAVCGSPIGLAVTCASIYKFGGELVVRWGTRRLRRFVLEIVVAAAVATCVVAVVTGTGDLWRFGGMAIADALTIAWARQFPFATLQLYGLVALSGQRLVMATCAIAALIALYGGLWSHLPELAACAAAALYPVDRLRQ